MSQEGMAGYTHRGGGDGPSGMTRQYSTLGRLTNTNGKPNPAKPVGHSGRSPLQDFVKAKENINGVFTEVSGYVNDVTQFLKILSAEQNLVEKEAALQAEGFSASIMSIKEVLARDHMKVVFFGRTSNGKSTVVNSMLHAKVLPSGMGHTTRCFVQVEGSDSGNKYILVEGSDQQKNVESLEDLAHACHSDAMGEDALVRVCWPKQDSRLLQNDVVLVDSPGVDVSPEFDGWIDKHCLDADVFVLVSNAESTLTQTEKNFFHRVSEKISKPNLFILNNRWDASAAEPENMDQVRAQHTSRFIKFLTEELQVCSVEEARHRIYFVSAREMLQNRLKDRGLNSPTNSYMAEGYQARMLEFEDFEKQFELCISQSAIATKFEAHIEKGCKIVHDLSTMLEEVNTQLNAERLEKTETLNSKHESLVQCQRDLQDYLKFAKDQISQLSAEVQLKVSTDMSDEIKRLGEVIDNFDKPFVDHDVPLMEFKNELTEHAEKVLRTNLEMRFTGGLLQRILSLEQELLARMCRVLPDPYASNAAQVVQYRSQFNFPFTLTVSPLMADFNPDLDFRFSLGITSLIHRFAMMKAGNSGVMLDDRPRVFGGGELIPRPMPRSTTEFNATDLLATEDAMMKSIIYTSATYVANGGVGLLVVGGVLYRTVGWRVIALIGGVYGMVYVYERLSWNNHAKERSFKEQFCRHLSARLHHFTATITMSCDSHVTREMQEHLCRLQQVASGSQNEMKAEVDRLQKGTAVLEANVKSVAQYKGKARFLETGLKQFCDVYLQPTE